MKTIKKLMICMVALMVMMTACGKPNPFVGKWRGVLDVSKVFEAEMINSLDATTQDAAEYINFEGLEVVYNIDFTEKEVMIVLDENSVKDMMWTFVEQLKNAMKLYLEKVLNEEGISVEEFAMVFQVDLDTYIEMYLEEMDAENMIATLCEELEEDISLHGTYKYNEDSINISYEDGTYEEIKYVFDGENVILSAQSGDDYFDIYCVLQE